MRVRAINLTAATLLLAALPLIGPAAHAGTMVDSCMKAFVAQFTAQHTQPMKFRLVTEDSATPMVGPGAAEVVLTARDAHDNRRLATIVCTLDRQGQPVLQSDPVLAVSGY